MNVHRIIIIGAGAGGLRTALELAKRKVRLKSFQITLVDRNAEHLHASLLYEVSSGELGEDEQACVDELRDGASIRFEAYADAFEKKRIFFRRGEVSDVDWEGKCVRLADGEFLPYDDLVIAIGTETADHGIPGAKEYALPMKTLADGFRIRERLHALLRAREGATPVSVVVAGGGATGVEFAAEVAHALGSAARVSLLEAGLEILSAASVGARSLVLERLLALGVTVTTGAKLSEVTSEGVVVGATDGTRSPLAADVTVWTAGVRPLAAAKEWGLPVEERGYVRVDRTFAVEGMKNVHALGDCAAFFHPKTKARVPALAQVAVREAGVVAENIARHLERKLPVSWNPPERWMSIVPLGGRYAVADLGRVRLRGLLGHLLRTLTDFSYFLSILPPRDAWNIWRRGSRAYAKND